MSLTEPQRMAICLVTYTLAWLLIALAAAWHERRERALVPPAPPPDERLGLGAPVVEIDSDPAPPELVAMVPVLHEDEPRDTLLDLEDLTEVTPAPHLFSDVPPPPPADEAEELSP